MRCKVEAESAWFAARPSGTEDVYKIYGESLWGADHLRRVLDEAQRSYTMACAMGDRSPPTYCRDRFLERPQSYFTSLIDRDGEETKNAPPHRLTFRLRYRRDPAYPLKHIRDSLDDAPSVALGGCSIHGRLDLSQHDIARCC